MDLPFRNITTTDITSDRGPQFTSSLWSNLNKMFGTKQQHTTYSNGMVECLHRQLKNALKAHTTSSLWMEHLYFTLLSLRTICREGTKFSRRISVWIYCTQPGRIHCPTLSSRYFPTTFNYLSPRPAKIDARSISTTSDTPLIFHNLLPTLSWPNSFCLQTNRQIQHTHTTTL